MSSIRTRRKLSKELSEATGQPVNVTEDDVLEARKLASGSIDAGEYVVPYAKSIAKALGLSPSAAVTEIDTKRLYRIFYKAVTQYDKNISNVPDIGRMRLLIEKPEDVHTLRNMMLGRRPSYQRKRVGHLLDANPTNEIEIIEFEDFYHVPSSTGRIGIHITLNVTLPGKTVIPFEIQVLHKHMVKTEDLTRSNYVNAQAIRRTAQTENRLLTPADEEAIERYDASSRERYLADSIKYRLSDLLRPDLRTQTSYLVIADIA